MIKTGMMVAAFLAAMVATTTQAGEDWAKEEILRQLSELRRDLNALSKEVQVVKDELERQRSSGVQRERVPVSLDDDPGLGAEDARVAIVEFTDFQCPFCRRYHNQTFPRIRSQYIDTGKIKYVQRDFPLGFHAQAKKAAVAANCAGEQNAYWQMNDALFKNQNRLGPLLYKELAASLQLDGTKFDACLEDQAQLDEVIKDVADGKRSGVRGTPAFFIGKIEGDKLVAAELLVGARSFGAFSAVIDRLLNQSAGSPAGGS